MKKRPTSVTVIAWILIVTGGIGLVMNTLTMGNPMIQEMMSRTSLPIPTQYVMAYAGLLVTVVSGIALLKGINWARFLYVGWSVIALVVGIATTPIKAGLIPGAVVLIVIAFFLFRPKVNEYFAVAEVQSDMESI